MLNIFFQFIKNLFLRNFFLKLISTILAFIIFVVVNQYKERFYTEFLRVEFIAPSGFVVLGDRERVVSVIIRAKSSFFPIPPSREDLKTRIVLDPTITKKHIIHLTEELFPNLDKRYSLIIEEPFLSAELDELITKSVPIKPVFSNPVPYFEFVKVIPETLSVTGPQSEIETLSYLETHKIIWASGKKKFIAEIIIPKEMHLSLHKTSVEVEVESKK